MTLSSNASWAGKANAHRKKQDREDAAEFGRRVRCRRKALRLSQEQLGERSGLHRTYIGHVERGEVNPTLHNVLLVAQALDIDAAELVRGLRTDIGTAVPGTGTGGAPTHADLDDDDDERSRPQSPQLNRHDVQTDGGRR